MKLAQVGKDGLGVCFENSANLMLHEFADNPDALYVEGVVWNPKLEEWMFHAWVELNGVVFDSGHGDVVTILRERYYKVGKTRKTHKFNIKELRENLLRTGKYTNFNLIEADLL